MVTVLNASQLSSIAQSVGYTPTGGGFSSTGLGGSPPPNVILSSTPTISGVKGPTTTSYYSGSSPVSYQSYLSNSSGSIPASSIATPQQPINLLSQSGSNSLNTFGSGSLFMNNASLSGRMGAMNYTYDPKTGTYIYKGDQPAQDPNKDTSAEDLFSKYLGEVRANPPPSLADTYTQMEQQSGVQEKRARVQSLTDQLNTVTATANAQALGLTGQGRGIPEAIIGGQQAQIFKEAAIQALPIQAQLSAAIGDLNLAQDHLQQMFSLVSKDVQTQYEFRTNLITSAYDFATKEQQKQLDARKTVESQQFSTVTNNLNYVQGLATSAFNSGQSTIGSKLMQLMQNPSSSTFLADAADLAKGIQAKSASTSGPTGTDTTGTVTNQVLDGFTPITSLTPTQQQSVRNDLYGMGFNSDTPPAWFKEYIESTLRQSLPADRLVSEWQKYKTGILGGSSTTSANSSSSGGFDFNTL